MAIVYDRLTVTNNNNTSAINTNFQRIEEAMAEALGTEGRTPNSMNADIDLNSNDLLNVGDIQATTATITTTTTDTLNATTIFIDGEELDIDGITGPTGATGQGLSAGGTANQVLVKVDGTDYNTTWTDTLTNKTLTSPTVQATNGVALTGTQSLSAANAQSIFDLGATWNTSGTPTALKLNVTDTASNAASLLLDMQVGGVSKANFAKTGRLLLPAISATVPALTFSGATTNGLSGFVNTRIDTIIAGVPKHSVLGTEVRLGSDIMLGWSSNANIGVAGPDTIILRDAANTLGQRNGTNAQAKRLYFSYTDASNYTRMAFKTATGIHTIETESAGTGEANIDLALTPKGTGRVRFGTHSAIAAETVTGYITIKDAGGTSRKVAVVS